MTFYFYCIMFPLQVNRAFTKSREFHSILRKVHSYSKGSGLYQLKQRALVRVRGAGDAAVQGCAATFLQGLLTNDVRHLQHGGPCLYAMFLNTKGRVLYDTLVHAAGAPDAFLLECDIEVLGSLQKHLKMYRLKKKIDIDDLSREYNVYAVIGEMQNSPSNLPTDVEIHRDPRMPALGSRIISPSSLPSAQLCKSVGDVPLLNADDYKYLRYRLGVGEGVEDLPPGTCSPLEANCDYLHGVSFQKGCYIGQELTARVHHTGVVRRRFMPIHFDNAPAEPIPMDAGVLDKANPKKVIGKCKGVMRDHGLALVRVTEALQAERLEVAGHAAAVARPTWWPVEAPKDIVNIAKTEA